jgi:hypothetical protein
MPLEVTPELRERAGQALLAIVQRKYPGSKVSLRRVDPARLGTPGQSSDRAHSATETEGLEDPR